jgi:thiopeptide-type bacteriocin biosynthesis protein
MMTKSLNTDPSERYVPGPELLVRAPVLPIERFLEWSHGLVSPSAGPAERARAVLEDEQTLRRRLLELYSDPMLGEALEVASPSVARALRRWEGEADTRRGQAPALALTRYFTRMVSRATPFGLFSSCSLGTTEGETVELASRDDCRRYVRVDMQYVLELAATLETLPEVRARLRFRPSDALTYWPDRISFPTVDRGAGRSYSLVALSADDELLRVLAAARSGKTLEELARELEGEASFEDAMRYCTELVGCGALVSELQPSVWGEEPLEQVARVMQERLPTSDWTAKVERLRSETARLAAKPIRPSQNYAAVKALMAELPVAERERALQVDLTRPLISSGVPARVLDDLAEVLPVLERLAVSTNDSLAKFKRDFERRYGTAEVPLLEALDEERGIELPRSGSENRDPAPLLEGIVLRPRGVASVAPAGPLDAQLMPHLVGLWQRRDREWELSPSDVASLSPPGNARLSDGLSVMFQVVAENRDAVERGDYRIILQSCWGPSGAMVLGRFCHGDPAIHRAAAGILAREEALEPDALFAEVAHVPEGRGGNVVSRPRLRRYYVAYLAGSTPPDDGERIDASDLRVRLERGRFVLRSARLDRRVVVRLTTAHNHPQSSLAVYRFLCALQSDGHGQAGIYWGGFSNAPFLPRVRVGRVIVSPAAWRLSAQQAQALARGTTTLEHYECVQQLRAELELPRYVCLSQGDRHLLLDLDNPFCVNVLAAEAKAGPLRLTEAADPAGSGLVSGPDGTYHHELAVSFVRRRSAGPERRIVALEAQRHRDDARVPARLMPGSEFLSLKLYGGAGDLENVLLDALLPEVSDAVRRGEVASWFFLRYADPDTHLRLRLQGDPRVLGGEVLPRLTSMASRLIANRALQRVEADTYEREVERYGGSLGVVLSERVFEADSVAVGDVLRVMIGAGQADERWHAALVGMHLLLVDFCDGVEAMLDTVQGQRNAFGYEFGVGTAAERVLGQRFRDQRANIERWLTTGLELQAVNAAYATRSATLLPIARELRGLQAEGRLCHPLTGKASILASYLHMHAIRTFRSHCRSQELVLYDFLTRAYRSQLARCKKRTARRELTPA